MPAVRRLAGPAGVVALLATFSPPLEQAAHASMTGHMVQHVVLTLVAAPLLALWLAGGPLTARLPRGRLLPLVGLGSFTAVGWGWHLPMVYDAAIANVALHMVGHLALLGSAVLLWTAVARSGASSMFGYGTGIGVVFLAALQHAGLASLLLFAPAPLYAHVAGLDDQRLAAAVMAVPAKVVFGLAVAVLVFAWLADMERRHPPGACRLEVRSRWSA